MSSDPLARSDIWTGAPNEAEYDAVYASVMATERGRWFLTEYARRNRQADTQALAGAIARVEAAIRNDRPEQSLAPSLGRDLIEIAAAIERIRAAIGTGQTPASDLSGVVERIQDIAFLLRERADDAALCDVLDAAAREISVACARSKNGGEGSHDATVLLRDLAGRVDRIALSLAGDAVSSSVEPAATAAAMIALPAAGREPEAAPKPKSAAGNGELRALGYETAAAASLGEANDHRPRWYIEPPEFAFATTKQGAEPSKENGQARALLPETVLIPGPQDDPADLFEQPAADVTPRMRITSRAVTPDPLAGVCALSEEEVIALFS